MKLLLVFLSTLAVSFGNEYETSYSNTSCSCGWRNSGRIIGGKETDNNEYPWMVYLGGCGGSIITKWHVLTAAHCTNGRQASDITVSVGRHRTDVGTDTYSQEYKVEKIVEHKLYHPTLVIMDISVLVTAEPMRFNKYVGPVCLPPMFKRVNLVGQYVKATGWGNTQGTGDRTYLRDVDLKVIPLDVCRKSWPLVQHSGTQLCTFDSEKNTCNGDSGGPLVYLDPDTNRYTQAALVSYGAKMCKGATTPTVNTDLSVFTHWINKAVSSTKPEVQVCTKV